MRKNKLSIDEINHLYFASPDFESSESIFSVDRTVDYLLDDFRNALSTLIIRDLIFRILEYWDSEEESYEPKKLALIELLKTYESGFFLELRKLLMAEHERNPETKPLPGSKTGGKFLADISALDISDFTAFFEQHANCYNHNINYKKGFRNLKSALNEYNKANYISTIIKPNEGLIAHKDSMPNKRTSQKEYFIDTNLHVIRQKISYHSNVDLDQRNIKDCLNQFAIVVNCYLSLVSWAGPESFCYFGRYNLDTFVHAYFSLFEIKDTVLIDGTIQSLEKELIPSLKLIRYL